MAAATLVSVVMTLLLLTALPAAADTPTPIHIAGTGEVGAVNIHATSSTDGAVLGAIPEGASPTYLCFEYGQTINNVPIWFKVTYNGVTGFYTSYYDDAHYQSDAELTQKYGVPSCSGAAPTVVQNTSGATSASPTFYNRSAAVAWAVANWDHLPLIQNGGDCTWYTSQALWAGGLPTSDEWTKYSSNGVLGSNLVAAAKALIHGGYSPTEAINPTHTATDTDMLVNYLVSSGLATRTKITWSDNTANGAQLGDLIAYDWDHGSDGKVDHVAVVTGYSPGTNFPTVSQHSSNRLNRYWSYDPSSQGWVENAPDYQPLPGDGHGAPIAWLIHIAY